MIDEVITEKYVFKIFYTKGKVQEFKQEGSYEKMKRQYLLLKNNKNISKVLVFKLSQQQIDTSDWSS
ncbi:hypothetical protein HYQ15_gp30 [Lactococcus phage CHPC958]|uniref:Uncharacterized protein n=1 Tax=Lactococcus phage CHPC958 TaxID=2675254 RepID=A0A650ETF4_9CAUD|nr:hypothetical protein HYQ15_gp30 [Lactococcus phage CHPC958]QGT53206.1 hypothetical protein CHPC958_000866 [Lactococcus phage CHPC958]